MPQHVDVSQVLRESCGRRVSLKEVVDRLLRQWPARALLSPKQVGTTICRPDGEIRTEQLPASRMERVPVRVAAFEACDEDLIAFDIAEFEQRCFTSAQAVAVREIEEQQVTDVLFRNLSEEAFGLLLRVVLDRSLCPKPIELCSTSSATRRWALSLGMNSDSAGNPGFH